MGVGVGVGVGAGVGVEVGLGVGVGVGRAQEATSIRSRSMEIVSGLVVAGVAAGRSPVHPKNTVSHEAVTTTMVPAV